MGGGRSWIEREGERRTERKREREIKEREKETERPCLESSPVFNRM